MHLVQCPLCAPIPVVPALPNHSQKPPIGGNRGNDWVRVDSGRDDNG